VTDRVQNFAPDQLQSRPRRWLLIAVACAVIAAVQVMLNEQYRAKSSAYNAAIERLTAVDRAAWRHVKVVLGQLESGDPSRGVSLSEAQLALNNGKPFERAHTRNSPFIYVDPTTGGRALLDFHGERWAGASGVIGPFWNDPRLPPRPNYNRGLHGIVMIGRRLAYIAGYVVWLILLILFLGTTPGAWRYARIGMAMTLVEVALVSTFLAMLGPRYWKAWSDVFQDDAPGLGLIATAVSVVLLLLTVWRARTAAARSGPPRCGKCGYDLTGNESGVCPECGTGVMLRPA
jgi:hypothetical protein